MPDPPRRVPWAAIALVSVAAAALRIPFLGNQSLWYDETFTRAIVTMPSLGDVWHGVKATEGTPPLYYLVTWVWAKLFGVGSDAALRATAGIAGVAAAPAAFAALRRFTGGRSALATAAIVAASPMLVWYSLDARAYSLLVLLALVSIWALALLLEAPSRRRWIAWALAAAAALWTHYFAAFLVVAEVAVLLWRLPAERVRTIAWSALVATLALPLLPVLSAQGDTRTDHIGSLALGDRLEQTGRQLAMGPNVPRAWLEGLGILLIAGGALAGVVATRRATRLRVPLALAAIAVVLPLLLSITDVEDRLLARNMLIAFPALAALAAVGLLRLRGIPLALYLAFAVAAILWVEGDWRYQNADWRGAAEALPARAGGAPVAAFPALDRSIASIYLHRRGVPGPIRSDRIWLVVAPARIDRRDLTPVRVEPSVPPDFVRTGIRRHHGFQLIELRHPGPAAFLPQAFGHDLLGDPPALLVR
ncbi:MAG: mannosyltransferase [Thermoleophilaceae bacterium]|nr:mannosyltransferase [Thermoleophilaceae bacterium]